MTVSTIIPIVSEDRAVERRVCVFILGGHRSGTSALSRVLNIHGCSLPATLMGTGFGNEKGHWESSVISAFNDELLASMGRRWDDYRPIDADWYRSASYPRFYELARQLIRSEFGDAPLFVLKDPRICAIAPFWLDVLAAEGVEPAIVLPIRSVGEVASSLERRDGTPAWYGCLIWLRNVLDAEANTRGHARVFVTYEQLLSNWRDVVSTIGEAFGLVFPQSTREADEVDAFLEPRPSALDTPLPDCGILLGAGDTTSWFSDASSILTKWAEAGEDLDDFIRLDSLKSDFDRAMRVLGPLLTTMFTGQPGDGERLRADLEQRRSEIGTLEARIGEATQSIVDLRARLEEREALSERQETRFDIAQRSVVEARVAVRAAEQRANCLDVELGTKNQTIEQLSRKLQRAQALAEREIALREWLREVCAVLLAQPQRRPLFPTARRKKLERARTQLFDGDAYRARHADVAAAGVDPLRHYILFGMDEGRSCPEATRIAISGKRVNIQDDRFDFNSYLGAHPNETPRGRVSSVDTSFQAFGIIQHNPLISILVVSYNSGHDLEVLFPSIADQTYRNFEVILVENGTEDTEPLLRKYFPHGHFTRTDNVGFSEGNNVALQLSNGELIAPINPDTRIAPDLLQNLLHGLRFDESAAVAVPKINFFERFVEMRISADGAFVVSRTELLHGLNYTKIFVTQGDDDGVLLHSDEEGVLALKLPYETPRIVRVTLRSEGLLARCEVKIGFSDSQCQQGAAADRITIDVSFDAENCSSARYLINNAGSSLRADGTPYDRGFAQFDDGGFSTKDYVSAFCGCAALIRRAAILDRDLFHGLFFAYYEDSEFSHALGRQGYRILYQPAAEVFHRHSESTQEHSLSWNVLVSRGRRLYDAITKTRPGKPADFSFAYPAEFEGALQRKLEGYDEEIRKADSFADLVRPKRRTACIYNSYFKSMGGAEKHALDVASLLTRDYDVYLVSESDFDIDALQKYFTVDLSGVRKLICTNVDAHFTSKFDLFVNSTYQSNLVPAARDNAYIVSFPHRDLDRAILRHYRFLHNSPFTARWAQSYWGQHTNSILLPILGDYGALNERTEIVPKQKILISVGRFTYGGHCKNHHLIVDAFKDIIAERQAGTDWRLRVIGSCDVTQAESRRYLQDLTDAAQGHASIEIVANAERAVLNDAYAEAAIYIHATGLGMPADCPDRHEHFGITAFEALAHGCIPVVYDLGGPAEMIADLEQAHTFVDRDDLRRVLLAAMRAFETAPAQESVVRVHARHMHEQNRHSVREILPSNEEIELSYRPVEEVDDDG